MVVFMGKEQGTWVPVNPPTGCVVAPALSLMGEQSRHRTDLSQRAGEIRIEEMEGAAATGGGERVTSLERFGVRGRRGDRSGLGMARVIRWIPRSDRCGRRC